MSDQERIKEEKPKYEKPEVVDLSEPLTAEGGVPTPCASGATVE